MAKVSLEPTVLFGWQPDDGKHPTFHRLHVALLLHHLGDKLAGESVGLLL